jgi:hypothetical protein
MAAAPEEQLDYGLEGEDDMDDIQAMLAEAEEANKESTVLAEQGKADASDLLAKKEAEDKAKAERDERSVFVQNVHFNAKVDDLMAFFSTCGAIDRCTIVADKFGQPKGCVLCHVRAGQARAAAPPARVQPGDASASAPSHSFPPPPAVLHTLSSRRRTRSPTRCCWTRGSSSPARSRSCPNARTCRTTCWVDEADGEGASGAAGGVAGTPPAAAGAGVGEAAG